ncbi:MAG TPA: trimeric intracellular cation channel family protein [Pontibacter sp.]
MEIQYILELIGTFFFAISGALAVDKKDHDWFGAGFTGFITAIGGGTLRDMLLGSYPLVWIGDVRFLYAIFVGILFAAIFYKLLLRLRRTLLLFDTLGISLFTIVGTEKALSLGVDPVIAAIMGMFTAVMGGVIRDTLTNETPVIFRKEIYASACLAGATLYISLDFFEVQRTICFLTAVVLIIVIRLMAIKYNLSLPKFNRLG